MDTVGEFARIARDPGFRQRGEPIWPRVRLTDRGREFANGIHCYSRALSTGRDDNHEEMGGPLCPTLLASDLAEGLAPC